MADDPTNAARNTDTQSGRESRGDLPPQLPALRFRLWHLLAFVAALCALLAVLVSSTGMWATVFLLAALVISLHVAGTALGSRLRAHADQQRAWEAARRRTVVASSASTATSSISAAHSPLYGRRSSLRWLRLFVAGGALLGTLGGAVLLTFTVGHRTGAIGIAVGSISVGVIGGWLAFLGTSFWTILRQGWREASEHQKQDEARRTASRRQNG